jgi:hypothetical protein
MKILVYAARRWHISTLRMLKQVVGLIPSIEVEVLMCPRLTHETFPYEKLAEADLIYFRLHGLENQPFLYGQGHRGGWQTGFALALFEAEGVTLKPNCRVFFEGCYNSLSGIPDAFAQAGAGDVIAADTETYNKRLGIGPAGSVGIQAIQAWIEGGDAIQAVEVENAKQAKWEMNFRRHRR